MDINTTTSSTMSSTETNTNSQSQRVKKGDTSFLEEMNKFSVEQNDTTELSSEVEKNETKSKQQTSQTKTALPEVEIKVISTDKDAKISTTLFQQNNRNQEDPIFTNTTQLAQQNASQIVVNDKQHKLQINNNENKSSTHSTATDKIQTIVDEIQIVQKPATDKVQIVIDEIQTIQKPTTDKAQTVVNEKPPVQNPRTDKTQVIENSTLISPQHKEKDALNRPVKNEPIQNKVEEKTEIITKEVKTTKRVTERISDETLKENIIEQTQQIISEVTTSNQTVPVTQATTAQQNTPVIDSMQTLIEANKQLANITLLTDAKVVETKVTTKTNKESIKVDYSTVKMSSEDAVFFADLVQDTEKTLQSVVADLQSEAEQKVQEASKNVKVSATLMNAISEAAKTNQPMRIDFDKDVSIIIKIDKDGAVNAKFIPGDKAVEEYLKQNISALRQRFDEQELNYRDLSYSNRQKQNQEHNRRNNKERDHE